MFDAHGRTSCFITKGGAWLFILLLLSPPLAAQEAATTTVTIREYIVRGNTVLDNRAIEKAVYPYLGPDRTLSDIQSARAALQKAYQERGYQSVYVELPEQKVSGGVVYLLVSEVTVGRVRVVGAKYHSPLAIRQEVPALSRGVVPDFELVQEQLTKVNRSGKRQVMPLVKEGRVPGTMDVDLSVEDQRPWNASLTLNNDYSADTEKLRTVATLSHSNLWQRGHSASLTFFTAPENTDNAEVWSFSYEAPLSDRWSTRLSGYTSDSDVATVGGTNVLGRGHSYGVAAVYSLPFDGTWGHSFTAGIDFKDFEEALRFGGDEDQVPLEYAPFTFSYDGYFFTDDYQGFLNLSLVTASDEIPSGGSGWREFDYKRYKASPDFAVLKADANLEWQLKDWVLAGKVRGQAASGPLISNEQFAVGGAGSVRGYLAAEQAADDGYLASLELRTPSLDGWFGNPWRLLRFHVFGEGAQLQLRDPLPEQEARFDLASVGIGARAELWDYVSGSVDLGYPLAETGDTEKYDPRVHFSVTARF
ncbi:ShlB/FhaC/HecB family hemolysin secretion/activation protein [Alloalcanivorax marinus]|uniref:ShlB/FhaC/HecB family hemolysin secretion/activation protein n=1 Tax=Alloalcanivorax marinus TaxID=1177169 RepID=UPI001932B211|nr:ShlB/FhaC/HecB family hemolysin secretion/activation protein [Alloalcanivorax marinus]MBL7252537.1 ShlB/FhaC/HecB family hemolysin secretion/activation protein [Alloalcanivorax marinus]